MSNNIGICGNFSFGKEAVGGQSIKTRIISEALKKKFGENYIHCLDTDSWKKEKFKLFLNCIKLAMKCNHIIVLPAHNGVKIIIPLFYILSFLLKSKIHYVVVGAWLGDVLAGNKILLFFLRKVNYVYVQTDTLKQKLKKSFGLNNLLIMYNFKNIYIAGSSVIKAKSQDTLKVCCVSRIERLKGIEDAIEVVREYNSINNNKVLLDIYGPIKDDYKDRFFGIMQEAEFIEYKGIIEYNDTVSIIKDYYVLLFPTKYFTEGIPGTIIDAYASGVPVLCARWESCHDLIIEGKTGISYEFNDIDDFMNKFAYLIKSKDKVLAMKRNCFKEANKYTSEKALEVLINNLEMIYEK